MSDLYRETETSEKVAISFRIGMTLAAVASSRVLGIPALKHFRGRAGGPGRRADLVGLDRRRGLHVVEAKSRSWGLDRATIADAKKQAGTTKKALRLGGTPVETAFAAASDLSRDRLFVLLEDPPDEGEPAPAYFSESEFLAEYYQPITDLFEFAPPQPCGISYVDDYATGAWLPGSLVWLGVATPLIERLGSRSISEIWSDNGQPTDAIAPGYDDRMAATDDGYVLVISEAFANTLT